MKKRIKVMLSTRDLEVMMMHDPVASSRFLGVFASNEVPSKIAIAQNFIVFRDIYFESTSLHSAA